MTREHKKEPFLSSRSNRGASLSMLSSLLLFTGVSCSNGVAGGASDGDADITLAQSPAPLAAPSDLSVSITPYNMPVVIQATGGNIDYTIDITNNGDTALDFDLWTVLTQPDNSALSPILGPIDFILPGGWRTERMLSLPVSADAAPGSYHYAVLTGEYDDIIWSTDGFDFTKLSESASTGWALQDYDNRFPVLSSVYFADSENGWIVGSRNTILHTDDGGDNWYTQASPTSSNYSSVYFVDALTGWAVGTSGRIIHTTDGGDTWQTQPSNTQYSLGGVFFVDHDTGWAVGGKPRSFTEPRALILHTTDGGETWTIQLSQYNTNPFVDVFFIDSRRGWAIINPNIVFSTADGGQHWTQTQLDVYTQLKGVWFVSPLAGWIVGTDGKLFKTTNGGATWEQQSTGLDSTARFSSVIFINEMEGWISGGIDAVTEGAIFHTDDGGISWSIQEIPSDTNYLYDIYFTDTADGWAAGLYGSIVHTETGGH